VDARLRAIDPWFLAHHGVDHVVPLADDHVFYVQTCAHPVKCVHRALARWVARYLPHPLKALADAMD